MWSEDRRHHDRDLRRVEDDIGRLLVQLWATGRDLADDDRDGTEDSRSRLSEARLALTQAAGAVERAREQLPEGKQRPPLPSL